MCMNMISIKACKYRHFPINFDLGGGGQKLSRGTFHTRKCEKCYVLLTATELLIMNFLSQYTFELSQRNLIQLVDKVARKILNISFREKCRVISESKSHYETCIVSVNLFVASEWLGYLVSRIHSPCYFWTTRPFWLKSKTIRKSEFQWQRAF